MLVLRNSQCEEKEGEEEEGESEFGLVHVLVAPFVFFWGN